MSYRYESTALSIEAFIWNYRNGEPIGFAFDVVRAILSTTETNWESEYGCLNVWFENPSDCVDIYFDKYALETNHVSGIMISRPIDHPGFLDRVFRVLQLGDVMLFYSDETIPIFVRGADPRHYPDDLLNELGTPRFIDTPIGLLHQS